MLLLQVKKSYLKSCAKEGIWWQLAAVLTQDSRATDVGIIVFSKQLLCLGMVNWHLATAP